MNDVAPEEFADASQPADESKRRLGILAGLVAAAVLVVFGLVYLSGGAAEPAAQLAVEDADTTVDEPIDDVEAPEEELAEAVPTVTYDVYLARDPFDPVVPEEPAATGDPADPGAPADPDAPPTPTDPDPRDPADPADPSAPGDPSDPSDPRSPPRDPDAPPPGPDGECRGDREETVCNGQVVSLVDITTDDSGEPLAVIQVDSTIYEARRGERFASNFEVRAIESGCVSLLHGDDGFQLCEGDRVLK